MAADYYSCIQSIEAENGEVIILIKDASHNGVVVLTVDEALDRADAIRTLTLENTLRHRQVRELYDAFIAASMEARAQQLAMHKNGEFVDFRLKERNQRQLEIQQFNQG